MWSRTDGANAASEMICGRAPLPGTMSITDSGAQVSATVGLKDALDYRIITRKAARAGLESVFVNVIEARTPQQKPEIKDVTIEQTSVSGSCGVTVAFKLTNGDNGVFSSTLNSDGVIEHNNLKRTGRMAALLPQSGRMAMTDGSRFEAEGWKLELQQSWRMNLDGVIGDFTGETQQSALIVKSTMPLPTDDTLKGQFIYVQHQVNQAFKSIYSIEKISVYGKNLWRMDLSGTPPFIIQRSTVLQVNAADPRKMEQTFQFMTLFGTANTAGHRVHFPRSGFESRLVETGRSAFTIFNSPVAGQVIKGDAFVIYTIQKGDKVSIPSRFACTGAKDQTGILRLAIQTTGKAILTIPGKFTHAELAVAEKKFDLSVTGANNGCSAIEINPAVLSKGRGEILLKP